MKKKKKEQENELPKVNPELEGFEIKINSFGEVVSSMDIEKINDFLDRNLYDKKLKNEVDNTKKDNEENDES